MRRAQTIPIPMPDRGVDLSNPETQLDLRYAADAANCRYDYGVVGPRGGLRRMGVGSGTAMPFTGEIPLKLATFYDLNGTQYFLCITDTHIYKYDSVNDKWDRCYDGTNTKAISNVTADNPAKITTSANHGLTTGDYVYISGIVGDVGDLLNNKEFAVTVVDATNFTVAVDTTGKTYTSGGTVYPTVNLSGSIANPVSTCHHAHDGSGSLSADYYFVISNGVDPVLYWAGGSDFFYELTDTDSNTHVALQIFSYKESLILLGADSEPHKVLWSATGTINEFDDTTTSAGYLYLYDTPGEISWGGLLGDNLAVAKEDAIGFLSFTGNSDMLFRWDTVLRGGGPIKPGMIAMLKDRWIILTKENVEIWAGGPSTAMVGDAIFGELMDESTGLNWDNAANGRVLTDKANTRAIFYVPTGSDTYAKTAYIYNWRKGTWEIDELTYAVTACGSYSSYTLTTWSSLAGLTWADLANTTWSDYEATEGTNIPVVADDNGYVYQQTVAAKADHTTVFTQRHVTPAFIPDRTEYQGRHVRYLRVSFEAKGDYVKVEYSTDGGTTWNNIGTQSLTDDWAWYRLDFSTTARRIQFRFTNVSGVFYLREVTVLALPRGRAA